MNAPGNKHKTHAQKGFTLVEMSVVLVVIGLILGAVSIGRDMQRNAEYTKIKQKFVDPWVSAYNSYYMRAGVVLGDSQVAPNFMINGADFGGISGETGNMTGATAPAAICDGGAAQPGGQDQVRGAIGTLYDEMNRMGVTMPGGRAVGREARYLYLDSNGNPQELQVCFQWNPPGTASGSGNVMVISGLTPDLARALDQMIDGQADAREGVFRQAGVATSGPRRQPGVEWAANNTIAQGGSGDHQAADAGSRQDEDQVMTVTAHYKMTQ